MALRKLCCSEPLRGNALSRKPVQNSGRLHAVPLAQVIQEAFTRILNKVLRNSICMSPYCHIPRAAQKKRTNMYASSCIKFALTTISARRDSV
eukprot:1495019-Amphidinium_carterae.1